MPAFVEKLCTFHVKTRSFFGFGEVCAYSFAQMRTDRGKNVEIAAVWTVGVRGSRLCIVQKGGGQGVFFSNTRIENIPSPKTAVCV